MEEVFRQKALSLDACQRFSGSIVELFREITESLKTVLHVSLKNIYNIRLGHGRTKNLVQRHGKPYTNITALKLQYIYTCFVLFNLAITFFSTALKLAIDCSNHEWAG